MEWTPPPDGIEMCQGGGNMNPTTREEASMEQVTMIGIDLAKRSFQVHGARTDGSVAFRVKLSCEKLLPARPRLLGLARLGAAPAHHRRQAEAGQDIEDGPARPQAAVDHGRHDRRQRGGSAWGDDRSLARQDAGAQTEDADRSGAGQPNGADRLGADDKEGELPGSRRRLKRRSVGAVGRCRQDGERVRANGQRDGIGQTC